VAVLAIDIGKNTFHLVRLNKRAAIVLRQKLSLSRQQLEVRLANLPFCLIGPMSSLRACCTSSRTSSTTGGAWISAPRTHTVSLEMTMCV
jgi:hypothetical protein